MQSQDHQLQEEAFCRFPQPLEFRLAGQLVAVLELEPPAKGATNSEP